MQSLEAGLKGENIKSSVESHFDAVINAKQS